MIIWLWVGFIAFILAVLAIDLGVANRQPHVIRAREALAWTGVYVAMALTFNVAVYYLYHYHILGIGESIGHHLGGGQAAIEFFTGWLIEKSLSLDNIFIIALIFHYFRVPARSQHRVLFWGILGALLMRGAMIAGGTALIHRFAWITYVFGAILILTAVKMAVTRDERIDPTRNPLVRMARRWYPVTSEFEGERFFTRVHGHRAITPLLLALLVVESTDVLFAIDSIPAIFAVTNDPFIVFTSNVFAILGLRSLYFALSAMMDRFRYIKASLVALLGFVGAKMLLARYVHISTPAALGIIVLILAIGIAASMLHERKLTVTGKRKDET